MTAHPNRLPLPVRVLEHVAASLGAERAVSLDPDHLMEVARRRERLEDFGDPAFETPLALLVRSLEQDADLHLFGRLHLRDVIVRALRLRLRLTQRLDEQPEMSAGPARAPLIVCGLPRTGTTFLHRLLAALPDLRGLPLWKLVEPIAPRGPDHRLEEARTRTRRLQWLSGNRLDAQHLMRPELPDECGHLFRSSFLAPQYAVAPALGYFAAYPDCDATQAYREYRAFLGVLSREGENPSPRLVLKDPFHALFLDALFEALPGAMVVQTHRNPQEVVPSFAKLLTTAHGFVSRRVNVARVAGVLQRWLQVVAERSVVRAAEGRHAVLDIDYRALVGDPVGTVEHVHRRFGLPFHASWRAPLQALVQQGRQRPPNPYAASDFGLERAEIGAAFSSYTSRFL